MLFDGIVPVLTHTPPTWPRSITATDLPNLAAATAAFCTPGPEPMTTRSYSITAAMKGSPASTLSKTASRNRVTGSGRLAGCGTGGGADQSRDDGKSDVRGQAQRRLVLWGQGGQQLGHPLPAVPLLATQQRPPSGGDEYQSHPSVFGVVDPADQTLPLQALDELGHRRLAEALRRGQRR